MKPCSETSARGGGTAKGACTRTQTAQEEVFPRHLQAVNILLGAWDTGAKELRTGWAKDSRSWGAGWGLLMAEIQGRPTLVRREE